MKILRGGMILKKEGDKYKLQDGKKGLVLKEVKLELTKKELADILKENKIPFKQSEKKAELEEKVKKIDYSGSTSNIKAKPVKSEPLGTKLSQPPPPLKSVPPPLPPRPKPVPPPLPPRPKPAPLPEIKSRQVPLEVPLVLDIPEVFREATSPKKRKPKPSRKRKEPEPPSRKRKEPPTTTKQKGTKRKEPKSTLPSKIKDEIMKEQIIRKTISFVDDVTEQALESVGKKRMRREIRNEENQNAFQDALKNVSSKVKQLKKEQSLQKTKELSKGIADEAIKSGLTNITEQAKKLKKDISMQKIKPKKESRTIETQTEIETLEKVVKFADDALKPRPNVFEQIDELNKASKKITAIIRKARKNKGLRPAQIQIIEKKQSSLNLAVEALKIGKVLTEARKVKTEKIEEAKTELKKAVASGDITPEDEARLLANKIKQIEEQARRAVASAAKAKAEAEAKAKAKAEQVKAEIKKEKAQSFGNQKQEEGFQLDLDKEAALLGPKTKRTDFAKKGIQDFLDEVIKDVSIEYNLQKSLEKTDARERAKIQKDKEMREGLLRRIRINLGKLGEERLNPAKITERLKVRKEVAKSLKDMISTLEKREMQVKNKALYDELAVISRRVVNQEVLKRMAETKKKDDELRKLLEGKTEAQQKEITERLAKEAEAQAIEKAKADAQAKTEEFERKRLELIKLQEKLQTEAELEIEKAEKFERQRLELIELQNKLDVEEEQKRVIGYKLQRSKEKAEKIRQQSRAIIDLPKAIEEKKKAEEDYKKEIQERDKKLRDIYEEFASVLSLPEELKPKLESPKLPDLTRPPSPPTLKKQSSAEKTIDAKAEAEKQRKDQEKKLKSLKETISSDEGAKSPRTLKQQRRIDEENERKRLQSLKEVITPAEEEASKKAFEAKKVFEKPEPSKRLTPEELQVLKAKKAYMDKQLAAKAEREAATAFLEKAQKEQAVSERELKRAEVISKVIKQRTPTKAEKAAMEREQENLKKLQEEQGGLEELRRIALDTKRLEEEAKIAKENESKAQKFRREKASEKIAKFGSEVANRIKRKKKAIADIKAKYTAEAREAVKSMFLADKAEEKRLDREERKRNKLALEAIDKEFEKDRNPDESPYKSLVKLTIRNVQKYANPNIKKKMFVTSLTKEIDKYDKGSITSNYLQAYKDNFIKKSGVLNPSLDDIDKAFDDSYPREPIEALEPEKPEPVKPEPKKAKPAPRGKLVKPEETQKKKLEADVEKAKADLEKAKAKRKLEEEKTKYQEDIKRRVEEERAARLAQEKNILDDQIKKNDSLKAKGAAEAPQAELRNMYQTVRLLPSQVLDYKEKETDDPLIVDFNKAWGKGDFDKAVDIANKGLRLKDEIAPDTSL